jgi:hypothetical protein
LIEQATALRVGRATGDHAGSGRRGALDEAGDDGELGRIGERAHLGRRLHRVAQDNPPGPLDQPLDHGVMQVAVHDQA